MATIHLKNVPDSLYKKLEQLASDRNCPIDAQAIALLESAVAEQTLAQNRETTKPVQEIIAEIRQRREQRRTDIEWPDSTALIREDRDR